MGMTLRKDGYQLSLLALRFKSTKSSAQCAIQLHVLLIQDALESQHHLPKKDGRFHSSFKEELTSHVRMGEDSLPPGRLGVILSFHGCYGNTTQFSLLEPKIRVVLVAGPNDCK